MEVSALTSDGLIGREGHARDRSHNCLRGTGAGRRAARRGFPAAAIDGAPAQPDVVFADLAGYTAAADEYGDEAAAPPASEFGRAIAELSRRHGARQVKSLGDGAMIWAPDPAQAVALVASTLDELGSRPDLLPVRVGAHTGPAVLRDGDWYGSAVNVAARLAGRAEPNQALVSDITQSAVVSDLRSRLRYRGRLPCAGCATRSPRGD
jgi:adenylate cyclase